MDVYYLLLIVGSGFNIHLEYIWHYRLEFLRTKICVEIQDEYMYDKRRKNLEEMFLFPYEG